MSTIFQAIHDYKKGLPLLWILSHKHAKELNEKGYGIFATVNNFNKLRKENLVTKFNYYYVDIDGGAKEKQLQRIKACLTPSAIVESKNGYHVYWKCEEDLIEEYGKEQAIILYKEMNKRLVHYLKADKGVYDVTRILRVPGFLHQKNPKDPFEIKEVWKKDVSYSIRDMAWWFRPVPEKQINLLNIKNENTVNNEFWENAHSIDCIRGLTQLSGNEAVNGDIFSVKDGQIYVNGKRSQCWIDNDGRIGSHSSGGPGIPNWINWYHDDWKKTAEYLREVFPEISKDDNSWFRIESQNPT